MKKLYVLLFLSLLLVFPLGLFAVDFGGAVDNQSALEIEGTVSYLQFDKLTLWVDSEIGKYFYIGAQGSYTFSLTRPFLFDLEMLKFRTEPPIPASNLYFEIDAGRFLVSDFTERVLSHPLDGLNVHMKLPFMNTTVFAGYSGLLFKEPSRIVLSKHDAADRGDGTVLLAPSRLIGKVELDFFDLFLRQDLLATYLLQIDLIPAAELTDQTKGGKVNTHYFGVGLGGSPINTLYYDLYGYLSIGGTLSYINAEYTNATILAWMAGASVRWYPEKKLYSRILLDVVYGSGDRDNYTYLEGNTYRLSTLFFPIAQDPRDNVFTPDWGNLIITTLGYSFKPFAQMGRQGKNFQTALQGVLYLRTTTGAISEDYNTASGAYYVGTEVDLSLNYRPFSDLGLSLNGGIFFPNTAAGGVFLTTQRTMETSIKLDVSLSF